MKQSELTARDILAAHALATFNIPWATSESEAKIAAASAYLIADKMLEVREK